MTADPYGSRLQQFKQNEAPEAVLVIADNPELIRIVVAWTTLDIRRVKQPSRFVAKTESQTWEWLWRNAEFDLTELKTKIGVPYTESVLIKKMQPLIGNRILYPDGTVNSFVQRYLRERVLGFFRTKPAN